MTLDKFGRHIVKHGKTSDYGNSGTVDVSKFMNYNIILKFDSNKHLNGKFVLTFNKTHYSFPLKFGVIEKVILSIVNEDDILVSINDNLFLTHELLNFPLYENDEVAFLINPNKANLLNTLESFSAELVIKCPIKFEESLVLSERAYHTQ